MNRVLRARLLGIALLASIVPACGGGGGGGAAPPGPGAFITAFGTGGAVQVNPTPRSDNLYGSALSGGFLYLAGTEVPSAVTGETAWRIEKRSATDGTPAAGFGVAGVVTNNPTANYDDPSSVAVDEAGGALYVAGTQNSFGNSQWRVEKRNLTDGALVGAFGTGGVLLINPSANSDEAFAIVLDATGLYIAGTDRALGASNARWRVEKRNLTDGAEVLAFGTNGVLVSNPSTGDDIPNLLALESGFLLIGGSDFVPGDARARVEKHSATTGLIDPGFGGGTGAVSFDTVQNDVVYGLKTDGAGIYCFIVSNFANSRIAKFNFVDGQSVAAFGGTGVLSSTVIYPTNFVTPSLAFALAGQVLYIGGSDNVDQRIQVEARDVNSGALVTSFGSGGILVSDPTADPDGATQLQADATSLYVLGCVRFGGAADRAWVLEKRLR